MSLSYKSFTSRGTTFVQSVDGQKKYIEEQCIPIAHITSALKATFPKARVTYRSYEDKNSKQRVRYTIQIGDTVHTISPLACIERSTGNIYINEKSFDWFYNDVSNRINNLADNPSEPMPAPVGSSDI